MTLTPVKFQIGKQGITQGVLDSLQLAFKNHKNVRISVLKSSGRDKTSISAMGEEIVSRLPGRHGFKIIGFTIILKKLSNNPQPKPVVKKF